MSSPSGRLIGAQQSGGCAMSDRDSDVKGVTIGIVVGGRPTLGINGVIGAAPIEAANSGLRVLGMHHEFRHLADEYFTGMAR